MKTRQRKTEYTIRTKIGGIEARYGKFKSRQIAHDYLLKKGWVVEDERFPESLRVYIKGDLWVVIVQFINHYNLREFGRFK